MSTGIILLGLLVLTAIAYRVGLSRSAQVVDGNLPLLHSRPDYHGLFVALWCAVPAVILLVAWVALEDTVVGALVADGLPAETQALLSGERSLMMDQIRSLAEGRTISEDPIIKAAAARYGELHQTGRWILVVLGLALAGIGMGSGRRAISQHFRARLRVESALRCLLFACSLIAIFTTIGIVASLLFETIRFFREVSPIDFLFGLQWSPQTAIRSDQVGSSGSFGAVPVFVGTLLISGIAMLVAVPVGLMSAIYLAEYATPGFRNLAKPLLEILAGVPTVVYGYFAALAVAPALRNAGDTLGFDIASESALAAGLVMGIMIIPFVSSLSDDVITAVPQSLREGSLGLGATKSETIRQVVLPAALPGIVGSVLLAVSRAIGETMIVVMAAGLAANLSVNPFAAVTTVTVQIVTLLVGDQEFDSAKTLAAFALGMVLFVVTLCLNVIALHYVRKYRERYD